MSKLTPFAINVCSSGKQRFGNFKTSVFSGNVQCGGIWKLDLAGLFKICTQVQKTVGHMDVIQFDGKAQRKKVFFVLFL